jgi:hypothetical protein
MARRATLTHEALLALGPDKLAKLVIDEASRNAAFKRMARRRALRLHRFVAPAR